MAVSNGDSGHLYMQIATDETGFDTLREEDEHGSGKRSCCQDFIETTCFQMSIGAVILGNAIVIGLETDWRVESNLWKQLEDVFLVIFLLELTLKLCVYGCAGFFRSSNPDLGWNVFDFIIVTLGVTDRIYSHIESDSERAGNNARFSVLLMRTFRLLRLLRIIRIFRLMKQLYIIRNDVIEQHASASKMMQILYSLCEGITEARRASLFGQQPPSATLPLGAGDVSASLSPSRENTIEKRMSGVEDRLASVEMTVSGMNQTMSEMNQSMAQMNLSIRQMVAAGTLNSFSGITL